ncbi:structural protein [Synechococcus phage Ssp-JY38]|nr:hypothetical protein [Synechococcus phage Yong-L2-223]
MNSLVTIQNVGTVAWDGANSYPADIRKFVRFGWSFEVVTDIAVDAVFNIEAAPASDADPCVPGDFEPVPEISICDRPAEAGPQATVTIPAGTVAGTVCAGTIPCRPNAFVRIVPASGDTANVRAVIVRQGPMI